MAQNSEQLSIDDLEPDGEIDMQTAEWFQGLLMNCINAVRSADRDKRLEIKGRVFVLRDMFALSEAEVVELAETYGAGEEMAELLEVDDGGE